MSDNGPVADNLVLDCLYFALAGSIKIAGVLDELEISLHGPCFLDGPDGVVGPYAARLVYSRHGRRLHLHPASTADAIRAIARRQGVPQLTDVQIARQLAAAGALRTESTGRGRVRYAVRLPDGADGWTRGWDVALGPATGTEEARKTLGQPSVIVAAPRTPPTTGQERRREEATPPPARMLRRRDPGQLLPTSPRSDPLSGAEECVGGWARSTQRWPAGGPRRRYGGADPLVWEFDYTVWPDLPVRENPHVELRRAMSGVPAPAPAPWEWPEDPAVQHDWFLAASRAWDEAITRQEQLMYGILASLAQLHAYGFPWQDLDLHLVPTSTAERASAAAGDFTPDTLSPCVRREGDRWDNPIARYGWLARLSSPDAELMKAAEYEIPLIADALCRSGWSLPKLTASAESTLTAAHIRRRQQEWRRYAIPGPESAAGVIRDALRDAAGLDPHSPALRAL